MRKEHLFLIITLLSTSLFAQTIYQLDSVQWSYEKPANFELKEGNYIAEFLGAEKKIISVVKPDEEHVNHLNVSYLDNTNLRNLTFEIYVFSLVETYKKGYNNGEFTAEVQMERKKIKDQAFYLIRSQILHVDSNYTYVSDVYLAEINGKEFNVTITYDNDADKLELEESFFNARFL